MGNTFKSQISEGIPDYLPEMQGFDPAINRAPKRRDILSSEEKQLAVKNALRYFSVQLHSQLSQEFLEELNTYGRIYMYRFRPNYEMYARPLDEYPHRSKHAAAIMLMIQNNLDFRVAQHPYELITYGGNGAVFQNWAQYRLTMKYLSEMTDEETLSMYSGHPQGLFPSHSLAPRVIVTNGMMIPNYSKPDDLEKFNALGVTQYGQMTAGSYMYIGPQGIVHGTTLTLLNAGRRKNPESQNLRGKLFVSSGLGGMSGAQPKAAVIAGAVAVIAEVNTKAIEQRHSQGWVDEIFTKLPELHKRIEKARTLGEAVSLAYQGNIVDLWEYLVDQKIPVDLGSDQTSLHNPYSGGYYPVGLSFDESQNLMRQNPIEFKIQVKNSLNRHVVAIQKLTNRGMYFFDYGNAFLLEASRANAPVLKPNGDFIYPSYVQDIMGPLCFDYGFGPFRWICTSGLDSDLEKTDLIACKVLEEILKDSPEDIHRQLEDNIHWIKTAKKNNLVVGSKARILYADAQGRIEISKAFNRAIREGHLSGSIVLGRDHHDVSGTDSPFRETSNIYDGSRFTADMAVQNFAGDAARGATWVSLHNGGGVGWGEVINGGFGLVLDGTIEADKRLEMMLFWDVNNGIARRSWARNPAAMVTIKRLLKKYPHVKVTFPHCVE
jgi:urocanate hydratase